jgi:hypothetical protein
MRCLPLVGLLPILMSLAACGHGAGTADRPPGTNGSSESTNSAALDPGPARSGAAPSAGDVPYVVLTFFSPGRFPDKRAYLTGEMAADFADEPSIGESLPGGARVSFRHLGTGDVWAVSITAEGDHGDYYAYLKSSGGRSQLSAIRTLAVSPDIAASGGRGGRLAVSADSAIKRFGLAHLSKLDQVVGWFSDHPHAGPLEPAAPGDDHGGAAAVLARFGFAEAKLEPRYGRDVFVVIGGVTDNEAGFLHVPKGGSAPEMTPEDFIYVDRIAPGWYVYKTT